MRIEVRELVHGCFPKRTGGNKSDCFDLFLAEDITMKKGEVKMIGLGVAMKLPEGMVARVYSRSSAPIKSKVGLANGLGYIDNSYNGNDDEWKAILHAYDDVTLEKGTRVCQFEIALSQFATWKQKLKWLFSCGVCLVRNCNLGETNRGGIGSTGI